MKSSSPQVWPHWLQGQRAFNWADTTTHFPRSHFEVSCLRERHTLKFALKWFQESFYQSWHSAAPTVCMRKSYAVSIFSILTCAHNCWCIYTFSWANASFFIKHTVLWNHGLGWVQLVLKSVNRSQHTGNKMSHTVPLLSITYLHVTKVLYHNPRLIKESLGVKRFSLVKIRVIRDCTHKHNVVCTKTERRWEKNWSLACGKKVTVEF